MGLVLKMSLKYSSLVRDVPLKLLVFPDLEFSLSMSMNDVLFVPDSRMSVPSSALMHLFTVPGRFSLPLNLSR